MNIGSSLYRRIVMMITGSTFMEQASIKYGKRLASKFIASETREGALEVVKVLNQKGIMVTLDALGEGITNMEEATAYRDEYLLLIQDIAKHGVLSNVSLKPTQMGLALDPESCYHHIHEIVSQAQQFLNFVRIDMENSPYTQATIDIVLRLHAEGLTNAGTVIQAYLYRSEQDVLHLTRHGVRLRLVKGAYQESNTIAYPRKQDVMNSFKRLIQIQLDQGAYTAIATHDDSIISWVKRYVAEQHISKESFEFQMLYGLRTSLQEELAKQGYRIRCYVPYGAQWYPYYTRRLAEKPSNLWMVLHHMFH